MTALHDIPPFGRWTLGAHLAWGAYVLFGFAWLGADLQFVRPLLVASWFGTSGMFFVFGLVVAAAGWRRNETRYLSALLIFDIAAMAVVVELIRIG